MRRLNRRPLFWAQIRGTSEGFRLADSIAAPPFNLRLAARARVLRVPLLAAILTAVLLAILIALDLDISARADIFTDLTLRETDGGTTRRYRFLDPSPFSIWVPSDLFVRRAIRSGQLPLWNPQQGGGYSPLLTFQNGVMHPLRWLTVALPEDHAPNFLVVTPLLAAFTGMFIYLRSGLMLTESAALYGALVFLLCGNTMSVALFGGTLLPLVHLPWLLLAFHRWCEHRSAARFAILAVLIASLLLSGHPAYILTVAILVALVVLGRITTRAARLKDFAAITAASIVALALSAVALLPAALAFDSFWTYKTSSPEGSVYGFATWDQWLGVLRSVLVETWMPTEPFDGSDYFAFLGFWSLAIAAIGTVTAWRNRQLRFAAWVFPITFLLALPPPFLGSLAKLPPLVWLKPWYLFGGFAFATALTGSIAVDLLGRRRAFRLWSIVLAATVASPLLAYGNRTLALFTPVPVQPVDSQVIRFLRERSRGGRVTGVRGHAYLPNLATLTAIDDLRLVSPLISARYRTWFSRTDPDGLVSSYPTLLTNENPSAELLGDFDTALLLQSRLRSVHMYSAYPDQHISEYWFVPKAPADSEFRLIHQTAHLNIWENLRRRPRAEIVSGPVRNVRGIDDAAAALRLHGSHVAAVAEGVTGPLSDAPLTAQERVSIQYRGLGRTVLYVTTIGRRLVVLRDLWSEGWKATIDGHRTTIFPVNIVSRGVVVPEGTHRIVMTYRPRGFTAGAIISLVAATALLAIVFVHRRSE